MKPQEIIRLESIARCLDEENVYKHSSIRSVQSEIVWTAATHEETIDFQIVARSLLCLLARSFHTEVTFFQGEFNCVPQHAMEFPIVV